MVDISIGVAGLTALLGYAVVFLGIVFLMIVISIMGSIMKKRQNSCIPAVSPAVPEMPAAAEAVPAAKMINANEAELLSGFGEITVPEGTEQNKITAILAAISEMEKEG